MIEIEGSGAEWRTKPAPGDAIFGRGWYSDGFCSFYRRDLSGCDPRGCAWMPAAGEPVEGRRVEGWKIIGAYARPTNLELLTSPVPLIDLIYLAIGQQHGARGWILIEARKSADDEPVPVFVAVDWSDRPLFLAAAVLRDES